MQTSMATLQLFTTNYSQPKISLYAKPIANNVNSVGKRRTIISSLASIAVISMFNSNDALAFDFRLTVPDQTKEEAESVVKSHADDLLQMKAFIDSESWKEVQTTLRGSSGYLKQDLYTLIQAKPANERPLLRRLYSNLFNDVLRLDYAARSKDGKAVKDYYDDIVAVLAQIFSKL